MIYYVMLCYAMVCMYLCMYVCMYVCMYASTKLKAASLLLAVSSQKQKRNMLMSGLSRENKNTGNDRQLFSACAHQLCSFTSKFQICYILLCTLNPIYLYMYVYWNIYIYIYVFVSCILYMLNFSLTPCICVGVLLKHMYSQSLEEDFS